MALKEMAVPESPKLYTKRYQNLLGVDFSCDVTEVDQRRTPTGTNMISDEGANPVKRLGWRPIASLPQSAGKILKMTTREKYEGDGDGIECYIYMLAEHGLYELECHYKSADDVVTKIYRGEADDSNSTYKGEFFYFDNRLFVMIARTDTSSEDEDSAMSFVMEEIQKGSTASRQSYIPEATISRSPDGSGGMSLEPVNILNQTRIFSFRGDGTSTSFYMYPSEVRSDPRYQKMRANNTEPRVLKVEINTNGTWTEVVRGAGAGKYTLSGTSTETVYSANKKPISLAVADCVIVFGTAPPAPSVVGQDNVRITFTPVNMSHTYSDTVADGLYRENRQDLLSASSIAIYGHTTTDRVFVVGGLNKNKVYYSAVNDPTYFPDNNYITIGYDTNEVKGLVRVSDSLAAIKSDSIYDNTLYMIRGSFLDENMVFTVLPTSAKLGSLNTASIKTLIDEPLFLTRSGVFGIASTYLTSEKTIKSRSRFVDKKMLLEHNLENSCAVVWKKYYILCVNDHCYVLDGRKTTSDITGNTDYQYEAYYWEGIPAKVFTTYNDSLFFGTADGQICKFNTDVLDRTAYCDNGIEVWTEQGGFSLTDKNELEEVVATPICCEWSTSLDDDGAPQKFKTLNKKGNLVTLLPQTKTSADVTLVKDGIQYKSLDRFWANIFDWSELNFAEFPFTSNITARDDFIRKKVKKYKRLQIVIRNEGMFEPFGILGITKTYYYGNFAK